jgi:hypothetical protein
MAQRYARRKLRPCDIAAAQQRQVMLDVKRRLPFNTGMQCAPVPLVLRRDVPERMQVPVFNAKTRQWELHKRTPSYGALPPK